MLTLGLLLFLISGVLAFLRLANAFSGQIWLDLPDFANMATDDLTWAMIYFIIFEMKQVKDVIQSDTHIEYQLRNSTRINFRRFALIVGIGSKILVHIKSVIQIIN
jgi:hypothetical protein